MNSLLPKARQLEENFLRIQQDRMHGLPFLNPALAVQAVGFHQYEGNVLGVLITPWFMNLMLLPEIDGWEGLRVGEKILHCFPSGQYEFTVGEENGFGQYQICSLFSPMADFADQASAVATAEAVLVALMDVQNIEKLNNYQSWENPASTSPATTPSLSRRAFLPGLAGGR